MAAPDKMRLVVWLGRWLIAIGENLNVIITWSLLPSMCLPGLVNFEISRGF